MKSDNPNSGFYKAETSRTLDLNGGNPSCNQGGIAVVCVDQGGGKSSCSVTEDYSPTLTCTHGGEPAVCLQGSMIGRKDENGPQGDGINEDVSFTLNATDKHAVAYGIDRAAFNQGQNAKYGFAVETEKFIVNQTDFTWLRNVFFTNYLSFNIFIRPFTTFFIIISYYMFNLHFIFWAVFINIGITMKIISLNFYNNLFILYKKIWFITTTLFIKYIINFI